MFISEHREDSFMAKAPEAASSEPFVSHQDRPNVQPDTPLSELRVRDLQAILGSMAQKIADKKVEKNHYKEQLDKHVEKFSLLKESIDNQKLWKDIIDNIPHKPQVELPPDPRGDPINQVLTGLQNT